MGTFGDGLWRVRSADKGRSDRTRRAAHRPLERLGALHHGGSRQQRVGGNHSRPASPDEARAHAARRCGFRARPFSLANGRRARRHNQGTCPARALGGRVAPVHFGSRHTRDTHASFATPAEPCGSVLPMGCGAWSTGGWFMQRSRHASPRYSCSRSHRPPRGGLWLGDGQWVYRWNGGTAVPLTLPPRRDVHHRSRSLAPIPGDVSGSGSGRQIGFVEPDGRFHVLGSSEGAASSRHRSLRHVRGQRRCRVARHEQRLEQIRKRPRHVSRLGTRPSR